MKKIIVCVALILATMQQSKGAPLVLNFGVTGGSKAQFTGGATPTFEFTGTPNFKINSTDNGIGSADGLTGTIGGTYAIGTVTTPFAGQEVASVSSIGIGSLTINDGGTPLTAVLEWISIYTQGAGGTVNAGSVVNLKNIMYSGSNVDLLNLRNTGMGSGIASASFNFSPAKTLTQLTTEANNFANFTGTFTPVPEPLFSGLLLVGGIGALIGFRRRAQRQPISE